VVVVERRGDLREPLLPIRGMEDKCGNMWGVMTLPKIDGVGWAGGVGSPGKGKV
jgi:hypothetical protein